MVDVSIRPGLNMTPIPLPEVFQHTHAWTYGCPHASPSLGADSIVPPELSDPDVVYVRPPDKIHVFKTPGAMQYISVPEMPPQGSDPTGMRQMMEFLGFDKDHVDTAVSGVSSMTDPASSNAVPQAGSSATTSNVAQQMSATGATTSTTQIPPVVGSPALNTMLGTNQPQSGLIRSL